MRKGKTQEVKGRVKETVGDLTGNEKLAREGKADRLSGETKGKLAGFVDRLKGTFRRRH